jgi:hypothetical protein
VIYQHKLNKPCMAPVEVGTEARTRMRFREVRPQGKGFLASTTYSKLLSGLKFAKMLDCLNVQCFVC